MEEGKSVSRADLYDSDSSHASASDGEGAAEAEHDLLQQALRERLGPLELKVIEEDAAGLGVAEDDHHQSSREEEGLEFRLFGGPVAAAAAAAAATSVQLIAKIRVSSPELNDGRPPGLVVAERPRSYYFKDAPLRPEEELAALQSIAVSGEDVLALSRVPWPGCRLPWRVLHANQPPLKGKKKGSISGLGETRVEVDAVDNDNPNSSNKQKKHKTRLGKKSRILRRKKVAARRERVEAKEAQVREKKTRKNRNQKIKRRQKARDAKTAAAGAEATGGPSDPTTVAAASE